MLNVAKHINLSPSAILEAKLLFELGIKRCTTCLEVKDVGEFHKAKESVGGITSRCKICDRDYGIRYRELVAEDLLYRVNRAVLKRQPFGTHVCWLSDKSAHQAAAHLLGEYGLLNDTDARSFRSIFMNNLPAKIAKLEAEKAQALAAKEERKRETEKRNRDKQILKNTLKISRSWLTDPDKITNVDIENMLFRRMQHHLKNKRRKLKATDFSFTKLNFTLLVGYSTAALREHLEAQLPAGKTWLDVFNQDLHIDHSMPSAAFDLSTVAGVRACYALNNLTWLEPLENSRKGTLTDKDTVSHFRNDPLSAQLFGLTE